MTKQMNLVGNSYGELIALEYSHKLQIMECPIIAVVALGTGYSENHGK